MAPPRRPGASFALGLVIAAALLGYCLARYGDSVLGFFFLDDFWLLRTARSIEQEAAGWWAIFAPRGTLYRPLTQPGYFYALRQLFALDASGYHAVQLSVFFANTLLVLAIARRLTATWSAAAATALLYAAAPGHAVAVYWLSAFTMIGTAFVTFATVLWWLATDGRARAIGCAVLQTIALLCSEHALVLPILLGCVATFGPRRTAGQWRQLVPAAAIAGAYAAVKVVYFARVGAPAGAYAMHSDVSTVLEHLGRYAAATLNLATLGRLDGAGAAAVGIALLAAAGLSAHLGARGHRRWCPVALGLGFFLAALLPVLPLGAHYYDYYVGIAAAGVAIAVVGLCEMLPRGGGALALLLAAVVVGVDLRTCDRAVVSNPTLGEVVAGQQAASDLVLSLAATQRLAGARRELTVARSPITDSVIDAGAAHQVFFSPPVLVTVIGGATRSSLLADPGIAPHPLLRAPPDEPQFWSSAGLGWVREGAATPAQWYWSVCDTSVPTTSLPVAP